MSQFASHVDLASILVGGRVLAANNEFFAAKENLIAAAEAIFLPDKFVSTGKWMDGWETRRRRETGDDWCLIKLGMRGVVEKLVVDTSHFTGNYPEHASVQGCDLSGHPDVETLLSSNTVWHELAPISPLAGDSKNELEPVVQRPVTHLRLRIFPDGGVARLRAYGHVAPDWDWLDFPGGLVDLGALENGGCAIDCSDMFYGNAQNLLMPGEPANMGEGWETKRRRGAGNDWAVIELGAAGRIARVLVDTTHFKGNSPGRCTLEVCSSPGATAEQLRDDSTWSPLLASSKLQPHLRHYFQDEVQQNNEVTHVRLQIFPDGGLARLRLWGRSARADRMLIRLGTKNNIDEQSRREELIGCCGSKAWASAVAARAPYPDVASLMSTADQVWNKLDKDDWLEAFAAHPKIGASKASGWAKDEQAGASSASEAAQQELATLNEDYEKRFGYIYIVCATGKSADEMLSILRSRVGNDPDHELQIAAEEQRKITRLRLEKWLNQ
jgi:allantoicase